MELQLYSKDVVEVSIDVKGSDYYENERDIVKYAMKLASIMSDCEPGSLIAIQVPEDDEG